VPVFQRSIACLALAVVVIACGGSPSSSTSGPTATSVSAQPADLPSGMSKCGLSGDINSFLDKSKTKDPNTYTSFKNYWDAAQKAGATAEFTAFYSDSTAHCTSLESNSSDVSTATYKLVVDFVVQYKDDASAKQSYTNETTFGISVSTLKGGGSPAVEGTATGLTANSIVLGVSGPSQAFYIAYWQNKAFLVILLILNLDTASGKKAALAENSRIK
jgi:hypothetical protein